MSDRTRYHVILVEDNPADARLVREALAEHPRFGFRLSHYSRIEQALAFLEKDTPDIALLDYQLPDADDLDGLTRIIAAAPNLPVVMLTGHDDAALGFRMVQHGAQDYLVKGTVDAAMLVRAIRHAIERKGMSDRVRDSEERFTLAAAGSGDGIWDWQIVGDHMFLSSHAKTILGLPLDTPDENAETLFRCIHLDDVDRFQDALTAHLKGETASFRQQARIMPPNRHPRWVLIRGLAGTDAKGQARRMAGSITDLASVDAYYDAVTGLPGPALVMDRLRGVLRRRRREVDFHSALLLISLSRYAQVSETLGHTANDELMAAAAHAIETSARPGDMVGRVNAREIAVVLEGVIDADDVSVIAGRIFRALMVPITVEGHDVVPTIRMGVVVTTAAYTDPEAVMLDATTALTEPVSADLPFCMYNPEMRQRANQRLRIESALRQAIEQEALSLVYQPIVALDGGVLRGFEALLRWHDKELGQVSPALFIPIAEETGLIQEIGTWVLRTACRQIADWSNAGLIPGHSDFSVSVNLSGRQLDDADSVARILEIVSETGISPKNLTLELTETALSADPDRARSALMAVKLRGINLAMDDFGTGYSSLSYLGRFPFDKIKIDQSFINTIAVGVASPLLKGMIGLTKDLGLCAVAEGVETADQHDVLAALGCQDGQGWLFGRPLDAQNAEAMLRSSAESWSIMDALKRPEDQVIAIDGGIQRRDAVIVATDIIDYTRMMTLDRVEAAGAVKDMRSVVDPMIVAFRGRIAGTHGDSYLTEFANAVDAVTCAMAIQSAFAARNAAQPADRRMQFRIGIDLDDIIVQGSRILGDGVDIAIGLKALAMPGGVYVSGKVYNDIARKIDLHFEDIGFWDVENIASPIRTYRADVESLVTA